MHPFSLWKVALQAVDAKTWRSFGSTSTLEIEDEEQVEQDVEQPRLSTSRSGLSSPSANKSGALNAVTFFSPAPPSSSLPRYQQMQVEEDDEEDPALSRLELEDGRVSRVV